MMSKIIIYKILSSLEEFYPEIDLKTEEDGPPSLEIFKDSKNYLTIWIDIDNKIHITSKIKNKFEDKVFEFNKGLFVLKLRIMVREFLDKIKK